MIQIQCFLSPSRAALDECLQPCSLMCIEAKTIAQVEHEWRCTLLGCLNNAQKVVVGKAEVFPVEEILYNNEKK